FVSLVALLVVTRS
ncbi:aminotransferase class-III family protein, partial [Vibrio parahaemolyticus V-223/04]